MSDNDDEKPKKPPTRKRVSRKRKTVNTAKSVNKSSKIWTVCHDTHRNLWQALCVDANTKEVQHRGEVVEGRNSSFDSLNDVLTKIYLSED